MASARSGIRVLLLATTLLIAACGGLKIHPPGPSNPTLLVFPVEVDSEKVVAVRHGFYYVYVLSRLDDASFRHEVEIKFPVPGDMVVVDTLPPGEYYVSQFAFFPIGTGDKNYGENTQPRRDFFTLESGKVTIFEKSLKITLRNRVPGRVASIVYNFDMPDINSDRKAEIMQTLEAQPGFAAWSFPQSASEESPDSDALPSRVIDSKWTGSWWPLTETGQHGIECLGGKLEYEVTGAYLRGAFTTEAGQVYSLTGKQDGQGGFGGVLRIGQKAYAALSGQLYVGPEIRGELDFDNLCQSGWSSSPQDE